MWLLNFLPSWFFYSLLVLGILGFAITFLIRLVPIPAIYMYKTPIQIVSVFLIVIGVYMAGSIANEEAWQLKVKEVEAKLAEAEAKGAVETIKIVEKIVVQEKIIRERGRNTVEYIEKEVVKYDNQCVIPNAFIEAHNRAATSTK